jgi:hypothetical protein
MTPSSLHSDLSCDKRAIRRAATRDSIIFSANRKSNAFDRPQSTLRLRAKKSAQATAPRPTGTVFLSAAAQVHARARRCLFALVIVAHFLDTRAIQF